MPPDLNATVAVTMLTPLDQPERAWCGPCALPSALSWQVVFEAGGAFSIRTLTLCADCGTEDWT